MKDLIFMSFDGEYVRDSEHETTEEAIRAAENIGSKWLFYPFCFILSGNKIVETGEGIIRMSDKKAFLELLFKNRKLTTVKKHF